MAIIHSRILVNTQSPPSSLPPFPWTSFYGFHANHLRHASFFFYYCIVLSLWVLLTFAFLSRKIMLVFLRKLMWEFMVLFSVFWKILDWWRTKQHHIRHEEEGVFLFQYPLLVNYSVCFIFFKNCLFIFLNSSNSVYIIAQNYRVV